MKKFYIFIEYAYLLLAIFLLVEAFRSWSLNPQKSYLYLAFSAAAVFMYFFKKKFRKKIENHDKKN
ncbi:MAG: hypothetical protein L3J08_08205 [Flavobacteriaceae bacterium]|nr:hypothetical protein [Flavobacteriaceae bacterium]